MVKLQKKFDQLLNDLENLKGTESFYDYEESFTHLLKDFGRELLESSLGEPVENRKKKRGIQTGYGKIELNKSHEYSEQIESAKVSPYLQGKLIFIGQFSCYDNGEEIANRLLEIKTNDTAIYRLTDTMGEEVGEWIDEQDRYDIEQIENKDRVYCQVDGSNLLTRRPGWKEVKLGRVFKQSSILPESADRQWIRKSEYVGHFGDHEEFETKISVLLDEYSGLKDRLVFVNDGAVWIENWITAEYPDATQILDFYHAIENVSKYANVCITNKKVRKEWISQTASLLKEKGYKSLIERIDELKCNTKLKKEVKRKLMVYLKRNRTRMDYPSYIAKGLLIGSGAIEAAHRNVLQKRMKLSGQRWSTRGIQNMINLRVINKSGHWDMITNKLRRAA